MFQNIPGPDTPADCIGFGLVPVIIGANVLFFLNLSLALPIAILVCVLGACFRSWVMYTNGRFKWRWYMFKSELSTSEGRMCIHWYSGVYFVQSLIVAGILKLIS